MRILPLLLFLLVSFVSSRAVLADDTDLQFFEAKIRPLLAERCSSCHSAKAEKLKGGLRLDTHQTLLKGGDNGPAIILGDPSKSRLIEAIGYGNVDLQMPPKGKLTDAQIADLTRWVKLGAPWPKEAELPAAVNPNVFDLQARKARHWAWQPVRPPALPSVQNSSWPKSPIDQFILAKLEEKGLSPGPPAVRNTLIRRATFDLTGLPPTPGEVDAFLNDTAPDAFTKVVDRLLASRRFGENWARHWMDLARYADTYGHEFDFPIANAWQYRDYLVRAFNADVPYDQFVAEHVAGDLLPSPRLNPEQKFNESIIATGFWYFTEQTHAPVDVRQHQCDRLDNQIDVFGKTFLGLTIACARCHDHKFDAIPQSDYYALCGFLESSRRQEAMLDPGEKIAHASAAVHALRENAGRELREALAHTSDVGTRVARYLAANGSAVSVSPEKQPAKIAAQQISTPLFAWSALSASADAQDFQSRKQQASERVGKQQILAKETAAASTLFKDFHDDSFSGWRATGWAFGDAPTRSGECELTPAGPRPITPGLAHSGLSNTAFRGVLRSPTFTLTKPQILYHLNGHKAQVRLIIDGYMMDQFSNLLFAGAQFPVETKGKFVWHRQAQDVGRYIGHRAYIELIDDDAEGFLAVDQIRFADASSPEPVPQPSALSCRVLEDPSVDSAQTLGDAYGAMSEDVIKHWRAGVATAEECDWLRWLLDQQVLELDANTLHQFANLSQQIRQISAAVPAPTYAPAITDGNGFDENLLIRGNPKTPGKPAPRQFLSALAGGSQPAVGPETSGRILLAKQLTDPSNPLLSRVMVNRIWHHLLGRGIVASVDNFGALGDAPSHLELLDYLADRFVREGWSTKRLIRDVMLTSTYQMSSAMTDANAEQTDPANILLHCANVRRLTAESIRDEILSISGRLDTKMYGPPVDIYLTPFMEGRGRPAASGPLDGAGRRSLYLIARRNFISPMLLAFDMPVPFNTMGRRSVSNVPAQALVLMNDPFVIDQAKLWSEHILEVPDLTPAQRIAKMYQSAFARTPSENERRQLLAFLDRQGDELHIPAEKRPTDSHLWSDLAHALMNVKEFIFLN